MVITITSTGVMAVCAVLTCIAAFFLWCVNLMIKSAVSNLEIHLTAIFDSRYVRKAEPSKGNYFQTAGD